MTDKRSGWLIPAGGSFFNELSLRVKLILRLMGDRRVHPLLKLIPLTSLLYFLVPDLLPGPLDDAVIFLLSFTVFPELCPPEVVKEHWDALTAVVEGEWREVSEGEVREIDPGE